MAGTPEPFSPVSVGSEDPAEIWTRAGVEVFVSEVSYSTIKMPIIKLVLRNSTIRSREWARYFVPRFSRSKTCVNVGFLEVKPV